MYGTSRGYLEPLLQKLGAPYTIINDHLDPYFGGQPPEPSEAHIPDFIALVKMIRPSDWGWPPTVMQTASAFWMLTAVI